MAATPIYLQKLRYGGVNNHQRTVDQMDNAVSNGNIGLDNFS